MLCVWLEPKSGYDVWFKSTNNNEQTHVPPLERRNQPQMLRSFWKQYPSYRVRSLLYKRYNELKRSPRRERVAGEPAAARGVHRRRGPAYGHRQQAPAAAEVRPRQTGRRAPRRAGRGLRTEHPGVGRRGRRHVTKPWRRGASTASGCAPTTGRC